MVNRYYVEKIGTIKASIEVVLASDYEALVAKVAAQRVELHDADRLIEALEAALKRYGHHDEDCSAANGRSWHPCTCGYSTANGGSEHG